MTLKTIEMISAFPFLEYFSFSQATQEGELGVVTPAQEVS